MAITAEEVLNALETCLKNFEIVCTERDDDFHHSQIRFCEDFTFYDVESGRDFSLAEAFTVESLRAAYKKRDELERQCEELNALQAREARRCHYEELKKEFEGADG